MRGHMWKRAEAVLLALALIKKVLAVFQDFRITNDENGDIVEELHDTEDEVKIAIAEVKYKNAIREIENKDKKFDQDLKKLDTEHTALQTEYDSIKEVISKNVDRSFKAFS